ncbi:MAG: hypothetical protein U0350_46440 [Caldilineaceae bacterium]
MTPEELDQLADNPNLIEGIYNWCDRWCERCPFTSRCLNYALGEEQGTTNVNDLSNEQFWQKLAEVFDLTLALLQRSVDELGLDWTTVDTDVLMAEKHHNAERAANHALALQSDAYAEQVDAWFTAAGDLFQTKSEQLAAQMRIGLTNAAENQVIVLQDAVDVIRWYQLFIHVKLQRALHGKLDERTECDPEYPKDSDGSAKVALIAIDRSLAAWSVLLRAFPDHETGTLHLLAQLGQLRRAVEQEFPEARQFVRPGFDTLSPFEE